MVRAKLNIHSDDEIIPENHIPHSPPTPPAVKNRQRRRHRNRPIPNPRSQPFSGMRSPRARRERRAKLVESEDCSPVSATTPPPPTRKPLDFGGGLWSASALPVPVALPPLYSDPKRRRRLPRSLFLFRTLPSWANVHGGVEAAESSEAAPCEVDGKADGLSSD